MTEVVESMGVDATLTTDEKPSKPWLFGPNNTANLKGRPKGSRNKLDEAFVNALYEDFKTGGVEAIRKCREDKPDVYLNVIAKVVPKQVDLNADQAVADLANGLHAVAEFLGSFAPAEGGSHYAGSVPNGSVLPARLRAETH